MPRGDGTGPMRYGSMSGRGAGYCAGFGVPGFMNPLFGRGAGFSGHGGGHGFRNVFRATGLSAWQRAMGWPAAGGGFYGAPSYPAPTADQQIDMLKNQAAALEGELDLVKKRMEELSRGAAEKET
jgi:hypothetical protein